MFETILLIAIIAAAALFLVFRARRTLQGKPPPGGCGCGGCRSSSCSPHKNNKPLKTSPPKQP